MKNLYCSLTALLFATFLNAQTTINPAWHYLGDATNTDGVADFWVNPQGDAYMIGHITTMPGQPHADGVMFIKTDTNGQELWRKYLYAASTDWGLFAHAAIGDESGNVFVVLNENYRYSGYTNARLLVRKYNPDGDLIWSQYYTPLENGPIESVVSRTGIYKNGILYLAGSATDLDPGANLDGLIVRIDGETGNLVQKIIFDSAYHTDDVFREIKVSDSGEMWAVGRSRGYMWPGGIYSHYDANVVKYNADGVMQWEHRQNGTSNSEDFGINLTIDDQGNCYTSNQLRMLGVSQKKVQVQKINPGGVVAWTYEYQGSSSEYNFKQPVELLPGGNLVLVTSNANGIVTTCLNGQTGAQVWTQNYNRNNMGAANHQRDLMTDADSNIYITGVSRDNTPMGGGYDMVTMKYDSAGNMQWLSNFNYGNYATMGDDGVGLEMDAAGNVYAIGWTSHGADFNDDFLLLKYGSSLSLDENDASGKLTMYPNPTQDYVTIELQFAGKCEIKLSDLNGRILKAFTTAASPRTGFSLEGLASGVYLVSVQNESGVQMTQRLIKH